MAIINCNKIERKCEGKQTDSNVCEIRKGWRNAEKPIPDTLTAKHLFGGGMYEFAGSRSEEIGLLEAMEADRNRQKYEDKVGKCRNGSRASNRLCATK